MSSLSAATVPPGAREKLAVRLIIALLMLAIALPYGWAATHVPHNALTPPGAIYGGLLYNADDQNVHLAWAKQARDGHLFFRDLFTHESLLTRPLFTNFFCLLMGVMSHVMPLVWAYHGLRVLCAALALWAFWHLARRVTPDPRARITALLLAAFAGGSGFLAPLLPGLTFIDRPDGALMMPEAFTFASAFVFPLFIASMGLLLAVHNAVLEGDAAGVRGSKRATLCAFAAALLLSNIHTYDVIPFGVALLLWAGFETFHARKTGAPQPNCAPVAAALVGAAIPLLYQLIVFRGSQEFRVKALTVTAAPPLLSVIVSYGPLLLLAVWGAVAGRDSRAVRLMALWAAATLLLIYAPVSFARKMIEGVHLPLCLLAGIGLWALLSRVSSRVVRRCAAGGFVALMSLSSLSFVLWCLDNASDNNAARLQNVFSPPLYLPPGDMAALRWLDASSQRRERAVLCLPYLGNYLPRATGRTVYLGHWAETLYFTGTRDHPSKLGEASRFFGVFGAPQMSSDEARAWLHQNHIGVVVMGFYEQQSSAKLPLSLPLLHRAGETAVYGVD